MLISIGAYLASGLVIGFCSGLFGIGGGILGVPVLLTIFAWQGWSPELAMRMAMGTSLAIVALTSISSTLAHYRKEGVILPIVRKFAPAGLLGAVLGLTIAHFMETHLLKKLFGLFLMLVAVQMLVKITRKSQALPTTPALASAATFFGVISGMLGLGGGVFIVPYFTWCGVPLRQAIGTTAACILPIAIMSALGYAWLGNAVAELPSLSLGFVYLPALFCISIASVLFAPLGAHTAHKLPVPVLRKLFSLLLALVGAKMVF